MLIKKIISKIERSVADDNSIKEYFLFAEQKDPLTAYNIMSTLEDNDESESDSEAE